MRIVCPSCAANFDVPDSLLPAGRVVRCARCGSDWTPIAVAATALAPGLPSEEQPAPPTPNPQSAEEPAAAAPDGEPGSIQPARRPAPPQRPTAMERLASSPAKPRYSPAPRLAWVASLALLAALVWSGYHWRTQIMDHWPPSARLYAAFGLQAEPKRGP